MHGVQTGWSMILTPVSVEPCQVPVGPLITVSRDPLEVFVHFVTPDLLSLIVRETNSYAAQCLEANNISATWETDEEELKAYLGFMVVMGVSRLPEIRDYWSTDPKLNNHFISSRITRRRLEEVTRYLHFVNNNDLPLRGEPGFHRLQKVMPVITEMKRRFVANYNPHPQNSIDEAMIPFKGSVYSIYTYEHVLLMYILLLLCSSHTCDIN